MPSPCDHEEAQVTSDRLTWHVRHLMW